MLAESTPFSRSFGCLRAPELPAHPRKILLVRSDKGPSEMWCKGKDGAPCGLLMMPMAVGVRVTDSGRGEDFHADLWTCWVCGKDAEVRYAPWIPHEREGTYDAA